MSEESLRVRVAKLLGWCVQLMPAPMNDMRLTQHYSYYLYRHGPPRSHREMEERVEDGTVVGSKDGRRVWKGEASESYAFNALCPAYDVDLNLAYQVVTEARIRGAHFRIDVTDCITVQFSGFKNPLPDAGNLWACSLETDNPASAAKAICEAFVRSIEREGLDVG